MEKNNVKNYEFKIDKEVLDQIKESNDMKEISEIISKMIMDNINILKDEMDIEIRATIYTGVFNKIIEETGKYNLEFYINIITDSLANLQLRRIEKKRLNKILDYMTITLENTDGKIDNYKDFLQESLIINDVVGNIVQSLFVAVYSIKIDSIQKVSRKALLLHDKFFRDLDEGFEDEMEIIRDTLIVIKALSEDTKGEKEKFLKILKKYNFTDIDKIIEELKDKKDFEEVMEIICDSLYDRAV